MSNGSTYTTTRNEATRIFRAIFGADPPALVADRFIEASERLNAASEPQALAAYYTAIGRIGDLEALEVACRYRRILPLLSAKFRVMVYIAETVPELQGTFFAVNDNLAAALWALIAGGLRTGWKLVKGLFLLPRGRHA